MNIRVLLNTLFDLMIPCMIPSARSEQWGILRTRNRRKQRGEEESDSMEQKRKARSGKLWIWIGILLLAAAAALTVYNVADSARAGRQAKERADALEHWIDENTASGSYSGFRKHAEEESLPTAEIDGELYIGIIEIPEKGLRLPVYSDWNYERLRYAPCRFTGSCSGKDLVICGHNFDSQFGPLRSIEPGAEVHFTAVDGKVYHYIVETRETLMPTDVGRMIENEENSDQKAAIWDLTLFTCNLGGQTRCAVRCILSTEPVG